MRLLLCPLEPYCSRGAKGPVLHARRVRHRPCGADEEVITVVVVNVTGRARRFVLEGGPRERKLLEFRNSRASGKDRKWVSDSCVRRASRKIKRALARELRYELRRVARLTLLGVDEVVDIRAMKSTFDREIC